MKCGKSQRGSVMVEFCFVFTILMLLVLGIIDFSLVIQQAMIVNEAAYSAAQYGAVTGNSSNTSMMQTIATNAAKGISGFSATATKWCSCSPGGSVVACTSTCGTYGAPVAYVQVVTSGTASILFKYTGFPLSVPLHGLCILRVQ